MVSVLAVPRGRPALLYHPLLFFESQRKDFWHGELRPGDAHTASGTLDLRTACFAKIPTEVRLVIVSADKWFYDHNLIEWPDAYQARFVIVARLTAPIKRKLPRICGTLATRATFTSSCWLTTW